MMQSLVITWGCGFDFCLVFLYLADFLYSDNRKWIPLPAYSGLVRYFLLFYQFIYYVAQKEHLFFMRRLLQAVECL